MFVHRNHPIVTLFLATLFCVAATTVTCAQTAWRRAAGPQPGSCAKIVTDSAGTLYTWAGGTVQRSTDHGHTWSLIHAPQVIVDLAADRNGRLFAGAMNPTAIIRWDPATTAWTTIVSNLIGHDTVIPFMISRIAVADNGDLFAVDAGGGVIRYTARDGTMRYAAGGSFRRGANSGFALTPSGTILVSNRGEIYRSVDHGTTFTAVDTILPAYSFASVGTTILAGSRGLAVSQDDGATWTAHSTGIPDIDSASIAGVAAGRSGTVVLLTAHGTFWYSSDTGKAWLPAAAPAMAPGRGWQDGNVVVLAEPDGSFIHGASDQGLLSSSNGAAWLPVPSDLRNYWLNDMAENRAGTTLLACLSSPGSPFSTLARSTDDGRSWILRGQMIPGGAGQFAGGPNGIWYTYTANVPPLRSTDDGLTWQPLPSQPPISIAYPYAMATSPDGDVYVVDETGQAFSSTDAGTTWQRRGTMRSPISGWHALAACGAGILISTAGYRSEDNGDTWQQVAGLPPGTERFIRLDDGRLIALTVTGTGLSLDSGRHWTATVRGAYWSAAANGMLYSPDFALGRIISSAIGDTAWQAVPGTAFASREAGYSGGPLFVTRHGTFIQAIDYAGIEYLAAASGVEPHDREAMRPLALAAFPNPAQQRLHVEYDLPGDCVMHIALFDVLGNEVATLSSGIHPMGHNAIDFDASSIPAGTYVVRAAGEADASGRLEESEMVTIVR
ncbi:MAG: hypothetical protein JST22_05005 [Bacteroidetes bacterium]|nr:hypothetical protein [Bacteroidota bacterium]